MPDERVDAAIAHWAPRFVAAGVDANDFERVAAAVETWEQWLGVWVRDGDTHARLAREAESLGRGRTAGQAWLRAALSYHFGKFVWRLDEDRYREATELAVEALRSAHRHLDPTAMRLAIPYGEIVLAANLRRPAGIERPPLVVLLPGLDSTKEEFFSWEEVFLCRGMATFSLDGPGQGETGLVSSIEPAYEKAVTAALDHLEKVADADFGRIGVAGVSLGGLLRRARSRARETRGSCRGDQRPVRLWRLLGDDAASDPRNACTQHAGGRRPAGSCEGRRAEPVWRRRAHRAALSRDRRAARPAGPVGADQTPG